jgi:hypothetical protein
VLQPSPLQEIFTMEERFIRNQRMVIESFFLFEWHEGRCDHFLNSQVRIMPTISAILQTGISFNVGSTLTPLLCSAKRMKEVFKAIRETEMARIYDNQDIKGALSRSNRHTSHLKSQ